jgi:hypothetical protein
MGRVTDQRAAATRRGSENTAGHEITRPLAHARGSWSKCVGFRDTAGETGCKQPRSAKMSNGEWRMGDVGCEILMSGLVRVGGGAYADAWLNQPINSLHRFRREVGMDAATTCPGCKRALTVPENAAGHQVRCSECHHVFTVPPLDQLFEDTCSTWIEQDVDELFEDRHHETERKFDRVGEETSASPSASADHGQAPPTLQPRPAASDAEAGPNPATNGATAGATDAAQTPATSTRKTSDQAHDPEPAEDASPEPASINAGQAISTGQGDRASAHSAAGRYPSELNPTDPRPHLVVLSVDSAGVRFGFDSQWLDHMGFRAAMPVQCVFTGSTDREALIARPLIFADQARGERNRHFMQQLTSEHEQRVIGDHSPAELVRRMGKLERMPYPFDLPVAYYVSTRYAHLTIYCQTRPRPNGGATCEVIVPDARAALDWLANVNGVCGSDYALLAEDVQMLHGEVWTELSETTRQRITIWCKLRPREEVRLYLNDADLGRRDEGLAGLLVTDQRLVFCKHHHRGQVERHKQPARVRAKIEGRFAMLHLEMDDERTRMIRIRQAELKSLGDELAGEGQVQLVTQQG